MKNSIIKSAILLILLVGCTQTTRLKTTYSFPKEQWNRFENPIINFNIESPGIYYDMFLELNFDATLAPENFRVTVSMYTPSGEVRSRDIMLDFSHKGEGVVPGNIRIILRREFVFADQGLCKFEIENRSSKVVTPGMNNISVVLEKSQ